MLIFLVLFVFLIGAKANDTSRENSRALNEEFGVIDLTFEDPNYVNAFKELEFRTALDDYFPSVTADGKKMLFTIQDNSSTPGKRLGNEDVYYVNREGDGKWSMPMPFFSDFHYNKYNRGSQSISPDGRYLFFVKCGDRDGLGSCDIYYCMREGSGWSKPKNCGAPLNSEQWDSTPTMSANGKEIFFASTRANSYGKMDLWSCEVNIDKYGMLTFHSPKNLGDLINTKENEFAPFIHADNNTLYFSSMGHKGHGGYDLFVSRRVNGIWTKPINLGIPFNGESDDIGFTIEAKGEYAYLSSLPEDTTRVDFDIFRVKLNDSIAPEKISFISGVVRDYRTKLPLQATVSITDQDSVNNRFFGLSDYIDGQFTTFLPRNGVYNVFVERTGYLFYSAAIEGTAENVEIYLMPMTIGSSIVLNNLYFAFNSDKIENTSFSVIEKLYDLLIENPKMSIEIIGHTDNIGKSDYNKTLSHKRAEAVKLALINRGIDKARLTTIGMGSKELLLSGDSEEIHAKNRRVEVKITSLEN